MDSSFDNLRQAESVFGHIKCRIEVQEQDGENTDLMLVTIFERLATYGHTESIFLSNKSVFPPKVLS